jgi:hypothetical protein
MTTATHSGFWFRLARNHAQAKTGPEPVKKPGPVFIHDAVLPVNGTTMLYEVMRKDAADQSDQDDPSQS